MGAVRWANARNASDCIYDGGLTMLPAGVSDTAVCNDL